MAEHPCKDGPNGTPCNRIRKGEAYDINRDCRRCWLFDHDVRYNLDWGGDGKVTPAPNAPAQTGPAIPKPMLLGDAIESALATVGVTKERVAAWLGHPCGCAERQRRLNELHQWSENAMRETAATVRGQLLKLIGG